MILFVVSGGKGVSDAVLRRAGDVVEVKAARCSAAGSPRLTEHEGCRWGCSLRTSSK
jgi:hypothetical protein